MQNNIWQGNPIVSIRCLTEEERNIIGQHMEDTWGFSWEPGFWKQHVLWPWWDFKEKIRHRFYACAFGWHKYTIPIECDDPYQTAKMCRCGIGRITAYNQLMED